MKSHDVNDHGTSDQFAGQAKKPWVTPSLDIISLQSAESGLNINRLDGFGSKTLRTRS